MEAKTNIRICLGSSCHSRGNNRVVEVIKNYLQENSLIEKVDYRGHLCCGKCHIGPNLEINGKQFNKINEENVIKALKENLIIKTKSPKEQNKEEILG